MNGYFFDFLFPKGHQHFSEQLINVISEFAELEVYALKGYYKDCLKSKKNIKLIEESRTKFGKGPISSRISSIKFMKNSSNLINNSDADFCIVSSFDTLAFFIGQFFFKDKEKIYLIHHNNVDGLKSKIKKIFFKMYMNKVNHIVLEDFIKDGLLELTGVERSRVFTIPHPLPQKINIYNNNNNDFLYDCCGLSNSNDEGTIESIHDLECKNNFIRDKGLHVILKSKKIKYDNKFLKIISEFISSEDYNSIINNSRSIFLPLPKSYELRMSGALIDALYMKKIIIGNDSKLLRYYKQEYPNLCEIIRNEIELVKTLNRQDKNIECEYIKFINKHSNESLRVAFLNIFRCEKRSKISD